MILEAIALALFLTLLYLLFGDSIKAMLTGARSAYSTISELDRTYQQETYRSKLASFLSNPDIKDDCLTALKNAFQKVFR